MTTIGATIRDVYRNAVSEHADAVGVVQDYMAGKGSHITRAMAERLIHIHVTQYAIDQRMASEWLDETPLGHALEGE